MVQMCSDSKAEETKDSKDGSLQNPENKQSDNCTFDMVVGMIPKALLTTFLNLTQFLFSKKLLVTFSN